MAGPEDPRTDAVRRVRPTFDVARAIEERREDPGDLFYGPMATWPAANDLYPDALPTIRELRGRGLIVGVAGNQPSRIEDALRSAGVEADILATSERWGTSKPSPEFFKRLVGECGCAPDAIAYVGDRVDFDVLPALDAGLVAIHIRRGPWGVVQARWPEAARATARIEALSELPNAIRTVEP